MNTTANKPVRLRVPEILEERKMSIVEFSRVTGLAYNTAGALARGHFDRIGMDTIAAICAGLNLYPADLFVYSPIQGGPSAD